MTPPAPAAIVIVQLCGATYSSLDAVLERLRISGVAVGRTGLRDFGGIDRGVVARWSGRDASLMPHGGAAVVRELIGWLNEHGIAEQPSRDPVGLYPEAGDEIEARMLHALATARSPLAIDPLLDQPSRWRACDGAGLASEPERADPRDFLVRPPLVVAIGASNIGKSSLVNALAGRAVSIVADEVGTTRDHVGVWLDLAGLVVRYADTPGLRAGAGAIEVEARVAAFTLARAADLLVVCGDLTLPPPDLEVLGLHEHPRLVVALRSDRGMPKWAHDASVSAQHGDGIAAFATLIRDTLLPPHVLRSPKPWAFWRAFEGGSGDAASLA